MSTKYVLLYESGELEQAPLHLPAHSARGSAFHERGELLFYGPFAEPLTQGSMAVFGTREAAEEFVAGDPFVQNGVAQYELLGWNPVIGKEELDRL